MPLWFWLLCLAVEIGVVAWVVLGACKAEGKTRDQAESLAKMQKGRAG